VDSTRALLDELMGKDRNVLPSERQNKAVHFSDPDICKFYICGFCPSELFTNTKSDLGPCNKSHDDSCKQDFANSKKKHLYSYEKDFIHYLQRLVDDLDRRIKRGHERLDLGQDDKTQPPLTGEHSERLNAISDRIQTLLTQIEDLGEEGKVEECQQLMKVVDQLKSEKETTLVATDSRTIAQQEKRMKVCEVCGAFLVVGDTDKRVASHMEGKQHVGYALIRNTLSDYKKTHREDEPSLRPAERESEKDRRYKSSSRDRDRDDDRERERHTRRDTNKKRDHSYDEFSSSRREDRDRKRTRDDY